uniref:Uncharacterized protein n=1 Tax=Arundo donax TaxID=35708 RepID=A0A0A9AL57_ARUDO
MGYVQGLNELSLSGAQQISTKYHISVEHQISLRLWCSIYKH